MTSKNVQRTDTESITLVEAVNEALHDEMKRDDRIVVLGEDVGKAGGVFRATETLYDEFGSDRVMDTPLAESGIIGAAVGMASLGLRPIAEIQFMGFIYPSFDQIVSHAARLRTRSRGSVTCPLVARMPYGGGIRPPEHHSESTEALLAHMPGIKVVMPSTPYDTKGLLISAIRDPDPVIFLEPKKIYRGFRQEVPKDQYSISLGDAAIRREGTDISVFTWGSMTQPTLDAADNLEPDIDIEVVDLRTISPIDEDTVINSFKKTGRAAIVQEAPRTGGFASELTTIIQENALIYQEAPIHRVTGFDVPFPLHALEDFYMPEPARIEQEIREVIRF